MLDSPDDSQKQAEWDNRCEDAPHCSRCGESVYAHETYTELGDFVFCEPCWNGAVTYYTEDLYFESDGEEEAE